MGAFNNYSNGNSVSYQWVSRVLITIVGALLLIGIGWLKTSQDELSVKVDAIPQEIQSVHDSVTAIQGTLSMVQQDHDDLTRLKALTSNQQLWIGAQVHGNKAQRELHDPDSSPNASIR